MVHPSKHDNDDYSLPQSKAFFTPEFIQWRVLQFLPILFKHRRFDTTHQSQQIATQASDANYDPFIQNQDSLGATQ